jgi:exodeoxyribonuclease V alpha subunit
MANRSEVAERLDSDDDLAALVENRNVKLSLEQESAVDLCADLHQEIVGVTGGAGTGKTLVLGRAYEELLRQVKYKGNIALAAPTGRAAKRVQELTGIQATTIHRLLEFPQPDDPDDRDAPPNEPKRNHGNPLIQRVVCVDESSMLGPTLFRQLLDALPKGGVIRFFGDNNQLPPVEEGLPPFIDVLERFPSVELTYNFRSNDEIIGNALRILRGSVPVRNDRFEIIWRENPVQFVTEFATEHFMEPEYQIIMPTRRGRWGTQRVNPTLQLAFNPKGPSVRLDRFDDKEAPLTMRAGDKFLWIKNDYKLNMFNGEIGRVEWVDDEDGSLGIVTPERKLEVPARLKTYSMYHRSIIDYDPRKQIEHGYAITTHKSQGSEFKTIIYCMCGGQAWLLDRRNFYTAVTRAKQNVILITDRKAMGMSLRKRKLI